MRASPLLLPVIACAILASIPVSRCAEADDTARAAVQRLVAAATGGGGMDVRFAAVNAAVASGDSALPWLISALKHNSAAVREDAARALGRLRAPQARQPLLTALDDPDPAVRGTVAEALGAVGGAQVLEVLLKQASAADEMDRRGAAVGLGTLGSPQAVPLLVTLCSSENWEERWRAAVALGKIGQRESAAVVSRLTRDSHPVVAAAADWAIGAIAGRPYFRLFSSNLTGGNSAVIWASAWALGVIGSPRAVQTLRDAAASEDDTVGSAARTVLLWLGDDGTRSGDAPAAAPTVAAAAAAAGGNGDGLLDLTGRWLDRYGRIEVTVTRPVPVELGGNPVRSAPGSPPLLVRLGGGDVLLVVPSESGGPAAQHRTLHSADGGKSWVERATLVRRPASVAVLANGSVLAYDQYAFRRADAGHVLQTCISRDGGRSFGPLQLARIEASDDLVDRLLADSVREAYNTSSARWSGRGFPAFRNTAIELPDGTLLVCGPRPAGVRESSGLACYRSVDRGVTWSYAGDVTAQAHGAALALASGGRIICLAGKGDRDRLGRFESVDGGLTWGEARAFPHPGFGPDVCRLTDGMLACAFAGPAGVRVMFNIDGGGQNWTDQIVIEAEGSGPHAGTALCEGPNGNLVLVYTRPVNDSSDGETLLAVMVSRITVTTTAP